MVFTGMGAVVVRNAIVAACRMVVVVTGDVALEKFVGTRHD